VLSGAIDPFVDTLQFSLDLDKYLFSTASSSASRLSTVTLRGYGPLPALPWGRPQLAVGLEHRIAYKPSNSYEFNFPLRPENNGLYFYFEREQQNSSLYAEAEVPLVAPGRLRFMQALDLQLAGRMERFKVDTGASYIATYANGDQFIGGPSLGGEPYFSDTSYWANSATMGLRYQPAAGVTLRISGATAFLPPMPEQLVKNPLPGTYSSSINDPQNPGVPVAVYTLRGGNPDLQPQNSESFNVGVIWEPRVQALKGLRMNLEYYRIEQFDAISTLSEQQIVDRESVYPERVIRDASGAITLVDVSMMNLYHRETEGWDATLDYRIKTRLGEFNISAVGSLISHLKDQLDLQLPEYDSAGFHPSEGGGPKYKRNLNLVWQNGALTAGWAMRYFGSYKVPCAAGSPCSLQYLDGGEDSGTALIQGGTSIESQSYHDAFISYFVDERSSATAARFLGGLHIQIGVKNIFDKAPPFDWVNQQQNYYLSPYSDMRLRSYWLSLAKRF
jgi:outer membrane receptor protein involved in Fe transport